MNGGLGLGIGLKLGPTHREGVGVPATAIRQRDSAVIRDRAGNTIQVRS